MDLETFHKGVYQLLVAVTTSVTSVSSVGGTPTDLPLQKPELVSAISENSTQELSATTFQLNATYILEEKKDPEDLSAVVVKEDQHVLAVSVDAIEATKAGLVYTVEKPLPTPTPEPKVATEESKKIEEPTLKTEEKKEDTKAVSQVLGETTPKQGSLNADLLFQMANNHRVSKGLPALEKDDRVCKLTQARAPQLQNEIFGGGVMHKGFKELNLPYWASENIAGYNNEKDTFHFWVTDYIHRIAVEGDYKYSCVSCQDRYCTQIFTNFVQK